MILEAKTPVQGCDFGVPHNGSGEVYRISYSQGHTIRFSAISRICKILASKMSKSRDVLLASPIMGSNRVYKISYTQSLKLRISAISRNSWILEAKTPEVQGCDFGVPHNGSGKVYRISYSQSHTITTLAISRICKILPSKMPKCWGVILAFPIIDLAKCIGFPIARAQHAKFGSFQDFHVSGSQNTKVQGCDFGRRPP